MLSSVSYIPSSPTTEMSYFAPQNMASDEDDGYYFALADVKGEIYLVQISLSTPPSALTLIDIKIFKHELATIFRHVQTTTLHPKDVRVIEEIRDDLVRYEEDHGTAFLAREIVDRLRKLSLAMHMTRMSRTERRFYGPYLPITGQQTMLGRCR